jgi:heptosyltransferase II
LEKNKYIDKIYDYGPEAIFLLKNTSFDLVINLEKLPEVCSFAESVPAKHYLGFQLNKSNGSVVDFLSGDGLIKLPQDLAEKRKNEHCWQKIISDSLGRKWHGQGYILGYHPKSKIKYDVGFNWTVGSKWPNKAWPKSRWEKLEKLIGRKYSISWQEGLNSLNEYIEWINSCKLIVTADTLGLHICLALKKKVIALFGPTSHREMYFYNSGSVILPQTPYSCLPCFKSFCDKKRQCMDFIDPEKVRRMIEHEFKNSKITRKL